MPQVIPGLVEVVDVEATVVLGRDEDDATVLYDLADGSTVTLDIGTEARPMDLSARVVVGSGASGLGFKQPFVYDRATASVARIDLGGKSRGQAQAADGNLVVGTKDVPGGKIQDVFVYNLDTGRIRLLDFLEYQDRGFISAISGRRLAGTFGPWDGEQAWCFDLDTGIVTDLHARLAGSNSWARDIDGDLVVGSVETPITWVHRAFVYDVATDELRDLAAVLGGSSDAFAVHGSLVVGMVDHDGSRAFVYDVRTGTVRFLPGLPASGGGEGPSRAQWISGQIVVGYAGSSPVAWDLAALP